MRLEILILYFNAWTLEVVVVTQISALFINMLQTVFSLLRRFFIKYYNCLLGVDPIQKQEHWFSSELDIKAWLTAHVPIHTKLFDMGKVITADQ